MEDLSTVVRTAYEHETFRPTLADVRRRARGGLRRRLPAFLATLALLLAGGGTAALVAGGGRDPNADCAAQWTAAGRQTPSGGLEPMPRFVLSVGDRPGIRVFAGSAFEFDCVPGSNIGDDGSSLVIRQPYGPVLAVTNLVWDRSSVFYSGVTLSGTTAVEMHFPESNRTYHAVVRDTHFGLQVPFDTSDETPVLSATGSFGVAVVIGPYVHSSPRPGPPAGQCGGSVTDTPALAGIDTAAPPVVIDLTAPTTSGASPAEVALAGSERTVVLCGYGFSAAFYAQDRRQPTALTVYGTTEQPDTWVLGGWIAAGTTSVTVTMSDGTHIPATIQGRFWLAWDPTAHANGPTPVLVTAAGDGWFVDDQLG